MPLIELRQPDGSKVEVIDYGAMHQAAAAGMGSWLSKAFKKITGTSLSSVVAPIAGAAASLIPVVGPAVAPLVTGALGPKPEEPPAPPPPPPPPQPAPAPATAGQGSAAPLLIGALVVMALASRRRR